MQVKNISARPHHVGGVLIAPGEVGTIPSQWVNSINKLELVPVEVKEANEPVAKESKKSKKAASVEESAEVQEAE